MYGKIFAQMYEGTLAGHWQAIVTMQQLVVLATKDGIVDMTADAISRRTSIPIEIITSGLEHLAKPDPYSRTPGEDGRRIVLLDDHRPWGWKLVNHAKYRALRNLEEKREADRDRIQEKRKKNNDVAIVSPKVADVAHTDADADTGKASPAAQGKAATGSQPPDCPHQKLIDLYHELLPTCTRVIEWEGERQALMRARWREQSVPNGKRPGYATEQAGLAFWRRYFVYVSTSEFLTGSATPRAGTDRPFVASLEWLVRPKNFAKVVEGNYHRAAA